MLGNEKIVEQLQELLAAYEEFIKGFLTLDKLWSDGRHHLSEYMNLEDFENEFAQYLQEKNLRYPFPDTYEIYQLKDAVHEDYAFRGLAEAIRSGKRISGSNYKQVYEDILEEGQSLDFIYDRFNYDHPADFKGHSVSVSDVIVLKKNGISQAYYVDTFGFKKLPDFQVEREPMFGRKEGVAYQLANRFITAGKFMDDSGYEYSIYDLNFHLLEAGTFQGESRLLNPDMIAEQMEEYLKNAAIGYPDKIKGKITEDSIMVKVDYQAFLNGYYRENHCHAWDAPIYLTSRNHMEEQDLNYESRDEREYSALSKCACAIATARIDAAILGVRLIGNLASEKPKLTLYYAGPVSERALMDFFQKEKISVANRELEIHPLNRDGAVSLEQLMEKETLSNRERKPVKGDRYL